MMISFLFGLILLPSWAAPREVPLTDLKKFAPIIVFHPDEKYGPMDPLKFFNSSNKERDAAGNLLKMSTGGAIRKDVSYLRSPLLWKLSTSPFVEKLAKKWERDLVLIEYWYHLPYNLSDLWFGLGNHEGDWEGIAQLIEYKKDEHGQTQPHLLASYYSQHKGGRWYCPKSLEWKDDTKTNEKRLLVYSSLGTHASFPHAGTYSRGFLLGADIAGNGKEFDAGDRLRELSHEPYYGYKGRWGQESAIPWNSGPRVPHADTKFLPRETGENVMAAMAQTLESDCAGL